MILRWCWVKEDFWQGKKHMAGLHWLVPQFDSLDQLMQSSMTIIAATGCIQR